LPMLLVQFIMECLCYMFLPIALALFALDSTRGLGMRYVQQTLAVLAWPIGFAVVDLVGYALLAGPISAGSAMALGAGLATKFTPTTLILGLLVAIWLVLGSLATPVVMQLLFCSGSPLSSALGHAMQLGLAGVGLARFAGKQAPPSSATASPAPQVAAVGAASSQSAHPVGAAMAASFPALAGSAAQAALPAPPSPLGLPSGRSPQALPPRGYTQPRPRAQTLDLAQDPAGDAWALSVLQQNQIPKAVSY
jgi:hypothetical protein